MAEESLAVEYREAPGFPLYRVGSDGTVWSRNRRGRQKPSSEWQRMQCKVHSKGYLQVVLINKESKTHAVRFVHHLVLEAFVGPCPPGMETCHFPNPDRTCNRLDNLRWDTSKSNTNDSRLLGANIGGGGLNLPNAKIDSSTAREIREAFASDPLLTTVQLGQRYKLSSQNIADIVCGRIWKNAGGPTVKSPRRPRRRCA